MRATSSQLSSCLARYAATAFLLAVCFTTHAHAQYSGQPSPSPNAPSQSSTPNAHVLSLPGSNDSHADPETARLDAARLKYVNDDRHKRLVADTDKLLELATELKAEVDKAGKDELSVTVVKRAAEMEKLAHDVKQRMTN